MKLSKKITHLCAGILMTSLIINLGDLSYVAAAKKATVKTKKITMKVGEKKTISIKNKKKKATYLFACSKKSVASVSKKGVVTAKKAGKATITVKEKSGKKAKSIGSVQVRVLKKKTTVITPAPVPPCTLPPVFTATATPAATSTGSAAPTTTPSSEPVTATPTPVVTEEPTPTPIPTIPPREEDDNYDTPKGFDQKKSDVTYGSMKTISYYSSTTEKNRKANVILPAGYSEEDDKEYPVLYLLHGIGGDHTEWLGANPVQLIGNMIDAGTAKEMIVVMPNVRARADDTKDPKDIYTQEHFKAFDNFINDLRDDLMPYINENYRTAQGRANTAIAGLSMGGRESLYIGLTMPDTFGYIGAFEPASGVLSSNAEAGLFTEDTLKIPDEYNNITYILIEKGTKDGTVGDNPLRYHNALTENGTTHSYYEIESGHDFVAWKSGLYNFARRIF